MAIYGCHKMVVSRGTEWTVPILWSFYYSNGFSTSVWIVMSLLLLAFRRQFGRVAAGCRVMGNGAQGWAFVV